LLTLTNDSGSGSGAPRKTLTLNIGQVSVSDGGVYKCVATNYLGTDARTQRVNVVGEPMVDGMPPRRMVSGSTVWVHCPYKGYPIRKITWIKQGKILGRGGVNKGAFAMV
jgi:hypothetical protein